MYTKIFSKPGPHITYVLALFFLLFQACQKSDQEISPSQAQVKVSVWVGEPEQDRITLASNKTIRRSSDQVIQNAEIKLDKGTSLEVSLVQASQGSLIGGSTQSASDGISKSAAASVRKPLTEGVKYRVAVYSEQGNYLESHDYTYGSGDPSETFPLNAGETYTFVAYSVNSETDLPQIDNRSTLSAAGLKDVSGELMYFKKTLKLGVGNNDLSVVLQHQFSQMTTVIEMDDSMTGSIETIQGMQVSSSKSNATLKFSDGSISYPQGNVNANVIFPSIIAGSRSIESEPTVLISPETSTATIKIGSLRIDSETKTDISIPKVKITPGHRYTLVLRFKTCSEDVTADGMNWRYAQTSWKEGWTTYTGIYKADEGKYYKNNQVIRNTFVAPQANYGFQFDITELDNAFNLQVNGQYIFKNSDQEQIQFETAPSLKIERNIQFVDGSEYTVGGIDQVYNMKGTLSAPLIRILISRNGEVTMLGSKTNGGPLFPLKLKGNLKFNKVLWDSAGKNTVVVTQKVAGRTIIVGKGSGKKRISCK